MLKRKSPPQRPRIGKETNDPGVLDSISTATEELFSTFFTCSPVGLYVVQDGKFQAVNPRFQEYIGYREDELIGKDSLSFVIPEQREHVRGNAIRMLKGLSAAAYEFMVITRQGEPKWIMETVTSIQCRGRKATFGNFMDVTDRKMVEEGLREREELYRAVVEQATEMICVVDVKSKVVIEANPACRKLLGYTEEELRRITLYDFIAHNRANVDQKFARVVEHGEHFLGERTWRRKDGSLVEMEVSGNALFYGGRRALCVVARDISDRKKAERERKVLTQRLIGVGEEERKRLARDLHDDLGQTLTALRFILDSLDESLDNNKQVQKQKCREALSLVEQTSKSVRTILFQLRPSVLDDLGLVPTLQWYITRFMNHRPNIKVTFDALGIKKRLRRAHEDVLFRVFQECFNNVVKHSRAENVEVSITYSHPKIILLIKDDGTGFDPQAHVSLSGDGGQGIGLLGMEERVDSVGGSFEVISRRGTGTIVRVELDDSREEKNE